MWSTAPFQHDRSTSTGTPERALRFDTKLPVAHVVSTAPEGEAPGTHGWGSASKGYTFSLWLEGKDPAANGATWDFRDVARPAEVRHILLRLLRFPTSWRKVPAPWQKKWNLNIENHFFTPPKPSQLQLRQTYHMLITEVREQTAETSNKMIDHVLGETLNTEGDLHLWSDCGPHFRSSENLAHHLSLAEQRKQTVTCSFLAEQHGKNILDSAFGQVGEWLEDWAKTKPIHNVQSLLQAMKAGASKMVKNDPHGPKWKCHLVDFGQYRQTTATYAHSAALKITRTYCLVCKPPVGRLPYARLLNRIFTDVPEIPAMSILYDVERVEQEAVEWKKAFYEGSKSWEEPPPDIGDTTVLCRRLAAQKDRQPPVGMYPCKTFAEKVAAKSRKILKDKARVQRQLQALQGNLLEDESSSSSTSTSSSSSDSEWMPARKRRVLELVWSLCWEGRSTLMVSTLGSGARLRDPI